METQDHGKKGVLISIPSELENTVLAKQIGSINRAFINNELNMTQALLLYQEIDLIHKLYLSNHTNIADVTESQLSASITQIRQTPPRLINYVSKQGKNITLTSVYTFSK